MSARGCTLHALYGAISRLPLVFIGMYAPTVADTAFLHLAFALGRTLTSMWVSRSMYPPALCVLAGIAVASFGYALLACGVKLSMQLCFLLGFSEVNVALDTMAHQHVDNLRIHFIGMEIGSAAAIGASGIVFHVCGCQGIAIMGLVPSLILMALSAKSEVPPNTSFESARASETSAAVPRSLSKLASKGTACLSMVLSSAIISTLFVVAPWLYRTEWRLGAQQFAYDYCLGVLLGIAISSADFKGATVRLVSLFGFCSLLPSSQLSIILLFGLNPPVHSSVHSTLRNIGYDRQVMGVAYATRRLANLVFLCVAAVLYQSAGKYAAFGFAGAATLLWAAILASCT